MTATLATTGYTFWRTHADTPLRTVVPGKVYRSGALPPAELPGVLAAYNIRTVVDFRIPGPVEPGNPVRAEDLRMEAAAIARTPNVRYVNIPSRQIPCACALQRLFAVLDDPSSYPVLLHCHHGTGRAPLYAAIYLIEYEGYANETARRTTRWLVAAPGYRSSFARGRPKGDFLAAYRPRRAGGMPPDVLAPWLLNIPPLDRAALPPGPDEQAVDESTPRCRLCHAL